MIISKTPYRLPLSGGGTDIDFYYKKSKGHLISVSIDQYVYVLIMPRLIDKNYLIQTTSTQFTNKLSKIQHFLIRETLKFYKVKEKMHIGTYSTVPTRTGLGTSSAMVIGLINCINSYKGLGLSDQEIVRDAYKIERKICKAHGGWQDQIISQYGGLLDIKISKNEKLNIKRIKIEKNIENVIKNNFLLVYTKKKRNSSKIILSQKKRISSVIQYYDRIKSFNNLILNSLKKNEIKNIGLIFNQHWKLKKSLSNQISDKKIDNFYDNLLSNFNIYGAKLIGAGGGGFFLVCTNNKKKLQKNLLKNNINFVDFKIEKQGSIIIED
jgi:D-glycero-alpha-D-manno-heptose-7-phosphate kinase